MIESRQLVQFLEVANEGSFRGAAKKLNLSQSALSRSIQRMEVLLGVTLFNRSSTKITLTAYGESLYPRAAGIINSLNDVQQELEDLKGAETGNFRVGFGPVYTDILAARSIGAFSSRYPNVKIYTEIGRFTELIEMLNNGLIDIFIGETSTLAPSKNYSITPLKKRSGVFCCRSDHPIFNSKSINHDLVARYPLVTCQLPFRLLSLVMKPDQEIHTDRQTFVFSNIVCDSFSISRQISFHSDAICLTPKETIKNELERGELRIIDFNHKPIVSHSGIVHLAGRDPSPAAAKFIDLVKEMDQQL